MSYMAAAVHLMALTGCSSYDEFTPHTGPSSTTEHLIAPQPETIMANQNNQQGNPLNPDQRNPMQDPAQDRTQRSDQGNQQSDRPLSEDDELDSDYDSESGSRSGSREQGMDQGQQPGRQNQRTDR